MNLRNIFIVALVLSISSCATILSPKKNKGTTITANVDEAKVFDEKNRLLGTTPFYYEPKASEGEKKLTIEKEGYKSQTITVSVSEKKIFAFMDAMFLCIPCLVDYPTGNIYEISQDKFDVKLAREYSKDVERVNMLFNDVAWEIKDGAFIGKDYKEDVFFRKSSFDSYLYKNEACAGGQSSRYSIINCSKDDGDNKLLQHSNTIELLPTISHLSLKTYKLKGFTTRDAKMEVVIKFTKRSGTVIKEMPLKLEVKESKLEVKPLLAKLLREAIKEAMDDDAIYKLLLEEGKNASGPSSTFNSLKINKGKTPSFNRNKDLIQHLMKGVVTIKHTDGHGSGFIVSDDGYVITNYHVVKDKKTVEVQFSESLKLMAEVVRSDDRYDIALLKINGAGFTALEMINSDSAIVGEDVFAIGTPEDISLGQTVTKGIVSGKRKIAEKVFLQTDVTINRGNSGGPLLNEDGKVIGMVTMKLIGSGIEGIGFCVPTNTIIELLNLNYLY
jgi:serine protease Do